MFKDVRAIWNSSKPSMVGRTEKLIEIIGPQERNVKEVLDRLRDAGVYQVNMIARTTKVGSIECWMAIPKRGERVTKKEISLDGQEWKFLESDRAHESDRQEIGTIGWNKGEKVVAPQQMETVYEDEATSSITTETSRATSITENRVMRTGGLNELEKFKTDIVGLLNKDREDRDQLRGLIRDMMNGNIGGIKK